MGVRNTLWRKRRTAATPGVMCAGPLIENSVETRGQRCSACRLGLSTLYRYKLSFGRWFTAASTVTSTAVVVLGIVLIGLAGTLTLALIERTRGAGIPRCVGAGAVTPPGLGGENLG